MHARQRPHLPLLLLIQLLVHLRRDSRYWRAAAVKLVAFLQQLISAVRSARVDNELPAGVVYALWDVSIHVYCVDGLHRHQQVFSGCTAPHVKSTQNKT